MKNITILFTGQYRAHDLFVKSLNDINQLKNKFNIKIIFSTWENEVNNNAKNLLKKYNIKYIETNETLKEKEILSIDNTSYNKPKSSCRGNTIPHVNAWKTMILYDIGLKHIDNDNFVLRTRTDVYIKKNQLEEIFLKQIPINSHLLKYKIWTPSFHISRAFIINDWCWFGYIDDLKKFIHYNNKYAQFLDTACRLFWISLFIENDNELNDIIKYCNKHDINKNYILYDKKYQNIMKKWYKICYKYFTFGKSYNIGAKWKWSNQFNWQNKGININEFKNNFTGTPFLMCDDTEWLSKLYNNKFDNEELSKYLK